MSESFKMSRDHPQLNEVLESGVSVEFPNRRCVPFSVQNEGRNPVVIFEVLTPDLYRTSSFKQQVKIWFRSVRAVSLTATLSPMLIVLLTGLILGLSPRAWVGGLAILAALLLQVATNVLNDIEDYRRLIDLPGGHGGSGVLQKAWLTVHQLRRFAWICVAIALLAALPTFLLEWHWGIAIGALGLVGALGYSARPLGLKYFALGDLAVFFLCGPLIASGAGLAYFSDLSFDFLMIGLVFGFLACAILHANNLQDIDDDRARGAITLAGLIGFGHSRTLLAAFYILAWSSLLVFIFRISREPSLALLSFLPLGIALVLTFKLIKIVYQASGTSSPLLNFIRIRAAQLHLIYGVSLALSLVIYGGVER